MQFVYQPAGKRPNGENAKKMLQLPGEFLRQMRVSVGNKGTKLDSLEMLEWLVTDIRQYQD